MILDEDPDKTNIAKVWFDNYKVFDSDETHEAKDGYEWRTVDMHIAIGDDRKYDKWPDCAEANFVAEYYQDNDLENDKITVNYNGEDYVCDHVFTVLNEQRGVDNPDYKNSIKESISAVESVCQIITGDKKATLGEAIKLLDRNGIKIHPALQEAFKKIYGYTSDEGGIRHAEGMFESNVTFDDAKYMLASCCAFVNYLMPKYDDIKRKQQ